MNDGQVNSAPDTVSITATVTGPTILLDDKFTRPDSTAVGEGWVEMEQTGAATVSINTEKLFFDTSSNGFFRPLVSRSFTMVNSGTLLWEFDFDWARTSSDSGYEVWMQLGDSSFLQVPSTGGTQFTVVGVDLRWGEFSGTDQRLVSRQNGGTGGGGSVTPLGVITGPTHLTVTVNMDAVPRAYSVDIDGAPVASGLFFDDSANVTELDTVRFVTNSLIGTNFTGRTFDDVIISAE